MSTASIRTSVLLLVLVASTPLVAAVVWNLYDDLQQADANSRTSLRTLASAMVSNAGARIAAARLSLELLGAERFSSQLAPTGCEKALRELTATHPHYREVFTTSPEGAVLCSSSPAPRDVGTQPWFQAFRATRAFQVSSPFFDGEHHVAALSLPLWQGSTLLGGLHLSVGLEAFDPRIPSQFLPEESRYGFFAADGVMVWRNFDPEQVIGTRPDAAAAREIVKVREGEIEALAVDGVTRLFSMQPMPSTGWIAFVGVPSSTVSAGARRSAWRGAFAACLAIAALFLIAATVARRIARPIADLERVARAVQHGDFSVKAREDGPRDVAEVARALNAMVEARQRSEEELKAFLENSAVIAWLKDEQGRLVFVSRNYLARFSLTRQAVIGKTDEEIWPPDVAARFRHSDQQLLSGSGPTEEVEQFNHPDGTASWWLTNKFVFTRADGGRLLGGLRVDVTAIELAERARRVSDALLDKAFGSSPIGMAFVGLDGRYLRVNRAFCAMLGRTEAELISMRFQEVSAPADLPRDLPRVAELIAGLRESYQTEKRYLHKDGHEIWAQLNLSVVRDADGKPTHNLAQIQDISERKAAEESARLAVVGTLAAGAAHEINNPLTYVLANLSWIEEELRALRPVLPEERRRGLEELTQACADAHGGAHRIREIIAGLKTFSRKPEGSLGPTDVARVMESALQLTNTQRRNQAVTVSRISVSPLVLANARQLEQVFINLLVNAAQAIPEGDAAASHRITVTVRPDPDGQVVAEVQDTGAGITDEVRPHLFEPFFTTKPIGAGTGLGLLTCHGIVSSFGGRIEVDSRVGAGSTFRVVLPGLPSDTSTPASPVPEQLWALPTGHRVLVVDDEPSVAQAIARSLRGGPEVVTLHDPREVLRLLARGEHYDLVVCDLMMPSLSGEDFQKQLRPLRPALASSMLFVTGGAFTASATAFLAATQNSWLQKPVDTNTLRRLVAERLASS